LSNGKKIGSGNLFYHTKNAARANAAGASAVAKELSKRFKVVKNKSSSDDGILEYWGWKIGVMEKRCFIFPVFPKKY
jgi:hypothetical protein